MVSATETPCEGHPSPLGSEGLLSRSFLGLLITQFLGAMNDNTFRWLIVPIGKEIVSRGLSDVEQRAAEGHVLAMGAVLFVLPYLLFASPAGYLADRFSKRTVIVGCKVAEIAIMIAGVAAILYGSLSLMFALLFLMGTHSAVRPVEVWGDPGDCPCRPDRGGKRPGGNDDHSGHCVGHRSGQLPLRL